MTARRRWQALIALLILLGGSTQLYGQGPFAAQIENFWRLISTGGRTFQTLRATNAIITTATITNLTESGPEAGLTTLTFSGGSVLDGTVANVLNQTTGIHKITLNALGTTSTLGFGCQNLTPAIVGATVQISPECPDLSGTAYNSVSTLSETHRFGFEVLPATNAGTTTATLKIKYTNPSGVVTYPFTMTNAGVTTIIGDVNINGSFSGGNYLAGSANFIGWGAATLLGMPGNGLLNIRNYAGTTGAQFNAGTAAPTVTSCGTGSVTTHSSNTAGEITPTGATACTVTFGAPNFTNQPFCSLTVEGATVTAYISAVSVSAFTVTGLASSEKFMYSCIGGI